MGYYVSTMIGIRTSGVFDGDIDMAKMRQEIESVLDTMLAEEDSAKGLFWESNQIKAQLNWCMCEKEHVGQKGGLVVIAGVMNYYSFDKAAELAKRLSKHFVSEVMVMSHDQQQDTIECQVFLDGKPLFEVAENPIGRILRRVGI